MFHTCEIKHGSDTTMATALDIMQRRRVWTSIFDEYFKDYIFNILFFEVWISFNYFFFFNTFWNSKIKWKAISSWKYIPVLLPVKTACANRVNLPWLLGTGTYDVQGQTEEAGSVLS